MSAAMGNVSSGLAGGVLTNADSSANKVPAHPKGTVHSAAIEYAPGNLATNTVYA